MLILNREGREFGLSLLQQPAIGMAPVRTDFKTERLRLEAQYRLEGMDAGQFTADFPNLTRWLLKGAWNAVGLPGHLIFYRWVNVTRTFSRLREQIESLPENA